MEKGNREWGSKPSWIINRPEDRGILLGVESTVC